MQEPAVVKAILSDLLTPENEAQIADFIAEHVPLPFWIPRSLARAVIDRIVPTVLHDALMALTGAAAVTPDAARAAGGA